MQKNSLKEAREAKGLTQADLSEALGFTTPQFISNAERGICQIPPKHYKKLAKLVGRSAVLGLIENRVERFSEKLHKSL
jgi:transcriptional regulator with XRE-family HTH domain